MRSPCLPRRLDLAPALVTTAALATEGILRTTPATGGTIGVVALSALTCAPLAWRSQIPLVALLAATVGVIVSLAAFHPSLTSIAVLMLGLYSVAVLGDRRRSLLVAAATAALMVAVIEIIARDHDALAGLGLRLLLALGALVVGDTVRSRRALSAANRSREQSLAEAREQAAQRRIAGERLRIARELHDTVAHTLVAINVRAGVAAHLGARPGARDGALADIMSASAGAIGDLRATLGLLGGSEEAPTAPALQLTSVDQIFTRARRSGLHVDATLVLRGRTLPSPIEHAAVWLVQKAVSDVIDHGAASRVLIVLEIEQETLHIDIADDGAAGTAQSGRVGDALRLTSERVAVLGGHVDAGPGVHGGWRVHARLPLRAENGRQA